MSALYILGDHVQPCFDRQIPLYAIALYPLLRICMLRGLRERLFRVEHGSWSTIDLGKTKDQISSI